MATVFYSWQSDTPSNVNRTFIEKALEAAIDRVRSDLTLDAAVREVPIQLDKDTQGVPGSPPIAATILEKIETCSAFVADLTFVGESLATLQTLRSAGPRFFPNPNVLLEYGYAFRCHGHGRMISLLNTAFGESHAENLPFDLRHLRWPIKYHLGSNADKADRKAAFEPLVASLAGALKLILESHVSGNTKAAVEELDRREALKNDPAVFCEDVKELIPETPFGFKISLEELPNEGRAYLRLYPLEAVPPFTTALEARNAASKGGLRPMGTDLSGWTPGRNVFGAIVYASPVEGKLYHLTQLFLTRELWGVDALALNATFCKDFTPTAKSGYIASTYVERVFTETLSNYLNFAKTSLNVPQPLQLEAGLTGVKGYPMALQHGLHGRILTENVRWTGTIPSYDITSEDILKPFFDYMWAECGIIRPQPG